MRKLLTIEKGKPSEDIRRLLSSNLIGTPSKSMVYQHLRVAEKLETLSNAYFLSVRLGGKAIGACCLIPRAFAQNADTYDGYYIRYFSFQSNFRSATNPTKHLTKKKSALRDEIKLTLDGRGLELENPVCYAYVDASNHRSKAIIDSFGFEKVGVFKTVFISRFRPKKHPVVTRLESQELPYFKKRVAEHYKTHSLVCLDHLGFENGAFVYRKEGRIVAGLQAHREHWRIDELPGSKHLINIISNLPYLNRLFQKDFHFLSVEGFFCESGFECMLSPLIETALATYQCHTTIACADPKSSFYQSLKSVKGGLIQKLISEKEIAAVARGNTTRLEEIRSQPIYVSGFDNM